MSDSGENDLAKFAEALGLRYEISVAPLGKAYVSKNNFTLHCYVKFKGLRSKRYAAFVYGKNEHRRRFPCEFAFLGRGPFRSEKELTPEETTRVRNEIASDVLSRILCGCTVRVSDTRRIRVPPSSCVDELVLRLAVANVG